MLAASFPGLGVHTVFWLEGVEGHASGCRQHLVPVFNEGFYGFSYLEESDHHAVHLKFVQQCTPIVSQ